MKNLIRVFSWLCLSLVLSCGLLSSSVDAISASGKKGITSVYISSPDYYSFTCTNSNYCATYGASNKADGWVTSMTVNLTSGVGRGDVLYLQFRVSGLDNTGYQGFVPSQNWTIVENSIESTQMNSSSQMTWVQQMTLTPRDDNTTSILFNGSQAFWANDNFRCDISGGNYYYDGTSQITDAINSTNSSISSANSILNQIHSDTTGAETNSRNIYNLLNGQIRTDLSSASSNVNTIRQQIGTNSGDFYKDGVQTDMANFFNQYGGAYASINTTQHQFEYVQANAQLAILETLQSVSSETTNISNYADEQRQADANIENQSASDIGGTTNAKTESLLASATGFATVLTNVNPSNCLINGNMGHFNIGQVDMCSDNPPSFIQIIGSLVMVIILVGLTYSLVNQILNLVKEMRE